MYRAHYSRRSTRVVKVLRLLEISVVRRPTPAEHGHRHGWAWSGTELPTQRVSVPRAERRGVACPSGAKGGLVAPTPIKRCEEGGEREQVGSARYVSHLPRPLLLTPSTRACQGLRRGADVNQSARCRSHVQEHLPVRVPLDPVRHQLRHTSRALNTPLHCLAHGTRAPRGGLLSPRWLALLSGPHAAVRFTA